MAEGVALERCGRCRRALYCGQDCQRAHWHAGHKPACKPGSLPAPPSPAASDGCAQQ